MIYKPSFALRKANNFLKKLSSKYKIIGNTHNVNFNIRCSEHFLERLDDRSIPKDVFESMVTRLIKYNICEIIYLLESGEHRINLYGDGYYMMGIIGNVVSDKNYSILLSTIYLERNKESRNRVVKTSKLNLKTKSDFYELDLAS
jgi:hypothetical protein